MSTGPFRDWVGAVLILLFYTGPLVLILLPPDVYGDALQLAYLTAVALASIGMRRWIRTGEKTQSPRPRLLLAGLRDRFGNRLKLLILVLVLPGLLFLILTGYFVGALVVLWPLRFGVSCGILAVLWICQRLRPSPYLQRPRITLLRAYFALLWVFVISFATFSKTSSLEECDAASKQEAAKILYSRKAMESLPELAHAIPYMALANREGTALYASFKPLRGQQGIVARIEIDSAAEPRLTFLSQGIPEGIVQAMAYDEKRDRLYIPIFTQEPFTLLVVDCAGGRFEVAETRRLDAEPGDIVLDSERDLLHVVVKPSRLITYRLPGFEVLENRDSPVMGASEGVAFDPGNGRVYLSSVGFHVAMASSADDPFTRRFLFTSMGLDVSRGAHPHLFVASPGLGTLFVIDPDGLRTEHTLWIGGGLRNVRADGSRDLVYAASYSSGALSVIDPRGSPPRVLDSLPLGKVLRRITVQEAKGRVFAASSCGIFEVFPEKMKGVRRARGQDG